MPTSDRKYSLAEVAALSTLQLIICNPEKTTTSSQIPSTDDIWGFGSGFILSYDGRLFFVTADHNVHPEDHSPDNDTLQRTGKDYRIRIICNKRGFGLTSMEMPVSGIYSFTGFKFDSQSLADPRKLSEVFSKISSGAAFVDDESLPDGCRAPEMPDFAIADFNMPEDAELLSNFVECNELDCHLTDENPKVIIT